MDTKDQEEEEERCGEGNEMVRIHRERVKEEGEMVKRVRG